MRDTMLGGRRLCWHAVGLVLLLAGSSLGSPVQHRLHRRQHVTQAMLARGQGPRSYRQAAWVAGDPDMTVPEAKLEDPNWRTYQIKLAGEAQENKRRGVADGVIMFGDSITEALRGTGRGRPSPVYMPFKPVLQSLEDQLGDTVRVRAISRDTTRNVIWRVMEGGEMADAAPKVVTLLIGTNDLTDGVSPEGVLKGIEYIVKKFLTWGAHTQVMVLALFPRTNDACDAAWQKARKPTQSRTSFSCPKASLNVYHSQWREKINEVNKRIEELASLFPRVTALNCNSHFLETDEGSTFLKPEFFGIDGLHMSTPEAVEAWLLGCMLSPLRELLKVASAPPARLHHHSLAPPSLQTQTTELKSSNDQGQYKHERGFDAAMEKVSMINSLAEAQEQALKAAEAAAEEERMIAAEAEELQQEEEDGEGDGRAGADVDEEEQGADGGPQFVQDERTSRSETRKKAYRWIPEEDLPKDTRRTGIASMID